MLNRAISGIMFSLLLIGMLTLAFNIQPVKATGTVYIRADGSIDPQDAPISTFDNVTYTLIDNIVGEVPEGSSAIVVERENIVVDGGGYTVQGTVASYSKGISLSGRSNVTIKNTHVKEFYYGIYLHSSADCKIENVTATDNNYGIALLWESNQNILSQNNATNNSRGIYIKNSNNNNITSNTIIECSIGIRLWDASNNILFGNIVSSSKYGIELWAYTAGSYGNILSGNVVSSSGVDGIVLNGADNNTLSGNIVSSNGQYGITLMADNNIIYDNILINNSGSYWSSGIYFGWTRNNIISRNTIKNNRRGIFLYGEGENNKIFHNKFINNTNQVYVSGEHSNVWDDSYPSGGNYWSDYTGVDFYGGPYQNETGSDGIGDSPYVIDEDNADRYPLMHPWSSLPVHNINTGLGYATIQEAINANETLNGHTIFVETGTYYENVVVNKTVSLIGENRNTTIIDGGRGRENTFLIAVCNVSISGFTIANVYRDTACVFVQSDYNIIYDNNLTTMTGGLSDGIIFWYSNSNIILGNFIMEKHASIILHGSKDNLISGNMITESFAGGVNIWGDSFNNTIEDNYILKSGGISLSHAYDNTIRGNTIKNDYCGIGLTGYIKTSGNKILENTIQNNTFGIRLSSSDVEPYNNLFYHNNLINNTNQVYQEDSFNNNWDNGYPSGGNYWSDYVGVDIKSGSGQDLLGSDGIGDTPYIIDVDNVDDYPLMNPYGAPPPQTYALTITATIGGTTDPALGTYSYTANSSVQVTAIPEAGYLFDYWELDDVNIGSANPYTVLMDKDHTLKAVFSPIPPPLSASISPLSASINVGESTTFTSTVSGGTSPYGYQWYLNGNPVSGATSNTWTFTPTTSGIYYVYLKVTDDTGNTTQSETARITVTTVPVGGYSVPIQLPTTAKPATLHIALLTIMTAIFITIKRKTKRKH